MNMSVRQQIGRIRLEDLPKHYQLLLPPPPDFQDHGLQSRSKVRLCSVATGTDEEIPDGYFLHSPTLSTISPNPAPQRKESPKLVENAQRQLAPPPAIEKYQHDEEDGQRSLGEVVSLGHQANLHVTLSMTTFSSASSSTSELDPNGAPPTLSKHYFQGSLQDLTMADSKALQISSLTNSCRKYSQYSLRIQDYEDVDEDDEEQEVQVLDSRHSANAENLRLVQSCHEILSSEMPLKESISTAWNDTTNTEIRSESEMDSRYQETETVTHDNSETEIHDAGSVAHVPEKHKVPSSDDNLEDRPSKNARDTWHAELSTRDTEDLNDEPASRHDMGPTNAFSEANVIIVASALSIASDPITYDSKSNQVLQKTSIQADLPAQSPISSQTLTQDTLTACVQTQIDLRDMERLMSPPLSMTTYTQTPQENFVTQAPTSPENKFDSEKSTELLPFGQLSTAFGHSFLDAFGRKCLSMHNMSDWNSSKLSFLTNFDGNLYRRKFSHAEAMLYTVMCQDSFQPSNSEQSTLTLYTCLSSQIVPALSNPDQNITSGQARSMNNPPQAATSLSTGAGLTDGLRTAMTGTVTLANQEILDEEKETVDVSPTPYPARSLTNIESDDSSGLNAESDNSLPSGYDADDEELPDVTEIPRNLADQRQIVPTNRVGSVSTRQVDVTRRHRHRRIFAPEVDTSRSGIGNTPRHHNLTTVAQVLPLVSGTVIKRIMKRGELKATMSDFC